MTSPPQEGERPDTVQAVSKTTDLRAPFGVYWVGHDHLRIVLGSMSESAFLSDGWIALLVLVALASLSVIVRTLQSGVPPMPSSGRVRARMKGLLRRLRLPRQGTVVELGSGWGSLSVVLSRALPEMAVIGYEISPVPLGFSIVVRRLFRASNLRLVRANFQLVSLREADLVVCYLSTRSMARLQAKFVAELKPSAVVVSNTFALPVWKPTHVVFANDIYRTPIYVYHAGACRSDGTGMHVDIVEPLPESGA